MKINDNNRDIVNKTAFFGVITKIVCLHDLMSLIEAELSYNLFSIEKICLISKSFCCWDIQFGYLLMIDGSSNCHLLGFETHKNRVLNPIFSTDLEL